jgi:hypothetical protein
VSRSNDLKPGRIPVQAARPSRGATTLEQLFHLDSNNCTPENICALLAKDFHVRDTEVALLWINGKSLKFLFPVELSGAGTIPLSSSAIAARTATTGTSEMFNNFVQVKHPSVFEMVKLGNSQGDAQTIQKMMSVPMLDDNGKVCGVIQISRKGFDVPSAGPDFTNEDLQRLELAARSVGCFLATTGARLAKS